MSVVRYLERIGIDAETVQTPDLPTLGRLQRAHVTTVPFETLSITGDPYGQRDAEGVTLSVPHLYEKIVMRERGGYCYELNGLFAWLLAELGYTADRVAARVFRDSALRIPANHHAIVVDLGRDYLVDVGTGPPKIRRPLPLAGSVCTDEVGIEWRIAASDRPDVPFRTEYRAPGDAEWTPRYVFDEVPRGLSYFEATNDFFQTAPESPFTGDPMVSIATGVGARTLSGDTLTETTRDGEHERTVTGEAWHTVLSEAFGLQYEREGPGRRSGEREGDDEGSQ